MWCWNLAVFNLGIVVGEVQSQFGEGHSIVIHIQLNIHPGKRTGLTQFQTERVKRGRKRWWEWGWWHQVRFTRFMEKLAVHLSGWLGAMQKILCMFLLVVSISNKNITSKNTIYFERSAQGSGQWSRKTEDSSEGKKMLRNFKFAVSALLNITLLDLF